MNDNELCHYGIKGMKWGVRRYQKSNERNQRDNYRKLKKGKFISELYERVSDNAYVEAMADRKAAGDVGIYLTEHGCSSELSKNMNSKAWKNFDKTDADWHKADAFITNQNKKIVDDLLGKYKNKKIGQVTAGNRLISKGEEMASRIIDEYGEMVPHYAKYFE